MSEPIVFVSHFRVKPGRIEDLRRYMREGARSLEADKPRTAGFLSFLDPEAAELSIVHLFTDADAMDLHFVGAEARARGAYELIEPTGWDIHGSPSEAALRTLRDAASAAGVPLVLHPEYVSGFMRPDRDGSAGSSAAAAL